MEVELDYWTSRKRVEIEMARCATSPEARLIHELTRRYGAQADHAVAAAFVGLVVGQIPAGFMVNDPRYPTTGDAISATPLGAAL